MEETKDGSRLRVGWIVFIALAVLTAVEIWISVSLSPSLLYLALTSVAKAALIVIYFMHVSETWRGEE